MYYYLYYYFGYCLLLLSEAEMPSEKRRIQERKTQLKEAAKRSTWLASKKPNSRWDRDFA